MVLKQLEMDMQKGRKYETETVLELQRGENTRRLTRSVVDAACEEGKKSKARTANKKCNKWRWVGQQKHERKAASPFVT